MNLKQLAEHLGLSQTTVSRAVNGYPEVGEETRRRVMTAVAETGYRPSQTARRLTMGGSKPLGVVWRASSETSESFGARVFGELIAASYAEGYFLVSVPALHDNGFTATLALFAQASIDAVVILSPEGECPPRTRWPLPVVLLDAATESEPDHFCVDVDYAWSALSAHKLLLELGHQNVGLVSDGSLSRLDRFMSGFRLAQPDVSLSALPPQLFVTPVKLSEGLAPKTGHRPTAYFCPTVDAGHALAGLAKEHGLSVGRDLSIIAFDDRCDNRGGNIESSGLTISRLDLALLARTLLKAVKLAASAPLASPSKLLVKPELIFGESTARAPERRNFST